jgi:hypothetical protein
VLPLMEGAWTDCHGVIIEEEEYGVPSEEKRVQVQTPAHDGRIPLVACATRPKNLAEHNVAESKVLASIFGGLYMQTVSSSTTAIRPTPLISGCVGRDVLQASTRQRTMMVCQRHPLFAIAKLHSCVESWTKRKAHASVSFPPLIRPSQSCAVFDHGGRQLSTLKPFNSRLVNMARE